MGKKQPSALEGTDDVVARPQRLERAVSMVLSDIDQAVRHFENKGKGGQQTSYCGPFANLTPSNVKVLLMWKQALELGRAHEK